MITNVSKPILFSGPMVRAILEGRKTQTRRIVTPQPSAGVRLSALSKSGLEDGHGREIKQRIFVGDSLWVRETWNEFFDDEIPKGRSRAVKGRMGVPARPEYLAFVVYRADGEMPDHEIHGKALWKPSIFMPRWASRITLAVTDVHIQRLQEISEKDAKAEGVKRDDEPCDHVRRTCDEIGCLGPTYCDAYADLWGQINGPDSWNENPWIWAYTFEVMG